MTRRLQIALASGATIFFLILLLPLSVALPLAMPGDSGLTARRASGTIWSGVLFDARLAGIPMGDTLVSLSPLALLTGEARLNFASAGLRGVLLASPGGFGIARGTGPIDVAVRVKPIPLTQLILEEASVSFAGSKCQKADGRVRAILAGDIGGIALPNGMSGTLRCDGSALAIPLISQSGMERISFRVTGDGKWQSTISVRTGDPATVAKLIAAGFSSGPAGFTLNLTGAL